MERMCIWAFLLLCDCYDGSPEFRDPDRCIIRLTIPLPPDVPLFFEPL